MTRRLRFHACFCLFASGLWAQSHDWKIVPGKRVGPIVPASTVEDLKRQFGAANVRQQPIELGEGFQEPGALVYPDSPSRSVAVVRSEGMLLLFLCYGARTLRTCQWKTTEGITFGTTLLDLEKLNRRPFRLAGFGWDWGGRVHSWNGGLLESLRGVWLSLEPEQESLEQPGARKSYQQVSGDHIFSSGHPAMQGLNPRVIAISVKLSQ